MQLKFDTTLDYFLFFIILIKIVFLLSAVGHLFLSHSHNASLQKTLDPKLLYWKERTEFVFIASMSLLLIYYFRPGHTKPLTQESSLLFFLFGCVLLITADWGLFFKEAPWYKKMVSLMK
jgi:hypothetical protein